MKSKIYIQNPERKKNVLSIKSYISIKIKIKELIDGLRIINFYLWIKIDFANISTMNKIEI